MAVPIHGSLMSCSRQPALYPGYVTGHRGDHDLEADVSFGVSKRDALLRLRLLFTSYV